MALINGNVKVIEYFGNVMQVNLKLNLDFKTVPESERTVSSALLVLANTLVNPFN